MTYQSLQQNLSQVAQICSQLSQNEQANVTKLQQLSQSEQSASQQLQQCAQLCNQVIQQMQQVISSAQMSGVGQFSTTGAPLGNISQFSTGVPMGAGTGGYSNWSNRPINTNNAFAGSMSGQFGRFETSKELTGNAAFNTNKDLGQ